MPAINRATVVCYPKHRQNKFTSTAPHLHLPECYLLLFSDQAIYHAVWPWDIRCPIVFGFVFVFLLKTQSPQKPFGNASEAGADRREDEEDRRHLWRTWGVGQAAGNGSERTQVRRGLERGPCWNSATLQTATAALISPTGAIRSERRRMSATGSEEGGDRQQVLLQEHRPAEQRETELANATHCLRALY